MPTMQLDLPLERELRSENAEPVLVFARHPRARRYIIRISPEGVVRVTIPRGGSKREAAAFADRERAWIEKQLCRLEQMRDERGTREPRNSGTPEPRNPEPAVLARARRDLPARLFELAARYGLTVTRVSVRNQRWRWGSCSRSGHICLNWRLLVVPDWVRDYVIIHELMHLKRMDHSPRFWKLVEKACPDFQAARRWLHQHSKATAPSTLEAKPPSTLLRSQRAP